MCLFALPFTEISFCSLYFIQGLFKWGIFCVALRSRNLSYFVSSCCAEPEVFYRVYAW